MFVFIRMTNSITYFFIYLKILTLQIIGMISGGTPSRDCDTARR